MKLTLKQIRESAGPLALLNQSAGLPVKKAYWLGRLADLVEKTAADVEKQRVALIKKHFPDLEANGGAVPGDAVKVFEAEFDELLAETIEAPDLSIPFEALEGLTFFANGASMANLLSGRDLTLLDWLIMPPAEEPTEEAAKTAGA